MTAWHPDVAQQCVLEQIDIRSPIFGMGAIGPWESG
jgi:hypothetical protein